MADYVSFFWFRTETTTSNRTGVEVIDASRSNLQVFIEYYSLLVATKDTSSNESTSTLKQLLLFQDNYKRIFAQYTQNERNDVASNEAALLDMPASSIVLVPTTEIRVDPKYIRKEIINSQNTQIERYEEFSAFWGENIEKILNNKDYAPLNEKYLRDNDLIRYGLNIKTIPQISVWVWCRKLGTGLTGKIINVTDYIISLTTNNADNGGNFQISLAPIEGNCDCKTAIIGSEKPSWLPKQVVDILSQFREIFSKTSINRDSKRNSIEQKRTDFYFHDTIGTQDIVFIKFEPLKLSMSGNQLQGYEKDFDIDKIKLAGQYFDMIGLVDSNVISATADKLNVDIKVSGRCLSKLLIEDGSYFGSIVFETGQDGKSTFINNQKIIGSDSKVIERIFGKFEYLSSYLDTSVEERLKFIFNVLYNVKICPDDLFLYVKDRTTVNVLNQDKPFFNDANFASNLLLGGNKGILNKDDLSIELASGIWQIFKLVIDTNVAKRRLVDSSIAHDSGSLLNFIRKVCQPPFVETLFDTYGDKFYMIVRRPPFDYEAYNSLKNYAVDIENEDVFSESFVFDDSEVYTWYRLTPKGIYLGDTQSFPGYFIPAVFLKEYAEIWGSRPLDVMTNYIEYSNALQDEKTKSKNFDYMVEQSLEDLKYLIISNAYLPFTRKGQIVMRGNRKIKKGTVVRYKPTGEVFYVDAVSQNYVATMNGPERQTILQVSRGMVEVHFEKYFRVVDLESEEMVKTPIYEKQTFNVSYPVNFDYDVDSPIDIGCNADNIVTEFRQETNPITGLLENVEYYVSGGNKEYSEFTNLSIKRIGQKERIRLYQLNQQYFSQMVAAMVRFPNATFKCIGHTDSDGSIGYNQNLGLNRATHISQRVAQESAKKLNRDFYSERQRIIADSKGESEPLAGYAGDSISPGFKSDPPQTELEKKQNRRIQFLIENEVEVLKGHKTDITFLWGVRKEIFEFLLKNKQFCDCNS